MDLIESPAAMRLAARRLREKHDRLALVPTMGNLHAGHLALVEQARRQAGAVIVSIYVNQMQFGVNEDYHSYPRTLEEDLARLKECGVSAVFVPTAAAIYPEGLEQHTVIQNSFLDGIHCGRTRPSFFTGVLTVVAKLFNIVQPDMAVFGEKDFQQLCMVRRMVKDLCFPVDIVSVPTVRTEDGLALSSRNEYLSLEEKERASTLRAQLLWARKAVLAGTHSYERIKEQARACLARAGLTPDYFSIVRRSDLREAAPDDRSLVILAAAFLGKTRILDNIQIDLVGGLHSGGMSKKRDAVRYAPRTKSVEEKAEA
ncbi:MAG: pantoate--beta-alanine ligase [Kistimonas sp.]|nr:pantoate--beta-alanine ligase [Kistimonas sp.]